MSKFTPEQIAEIRDIADHAAERLLREFASWQLERAQTSVSSAEAVATSRTVDNFLAEKRGWYQ